MSNREFIQWYRKSKFYKPHLAPHKIEYISIVRSLYTHRQFVRGVLLDVGAGNAPYSELFRENVAAYWRADIYRTDLHKMKHVDVYADAIHLPFANDSLDTVLMTQVLGYIYNHDAALQEIHRVLAPDGCLVLTYDQNAGQSSISDYFRFTAPYYRRALGEAGFYIEVLEPRAGAYAMVGEALSSLVYYSAFRTIPHRVLALLCGVVEMPFRLLDRIWFDSNNPIGHIVIGRKRGLQQRAL